MCYVLHPAVSTDPKPQHRNGEEGETLGARLQKNTWVCDGDMSKDEKVRKRADGWEDYNKIQEIKGERAQTGNR